LNPELLLPIERQGAVPLRIQIERGLRSAIQDGRLSPGAPLPATRALATTLGVSRGLVVLAYEQLLAEGYLHARRGSATRVATPPVRAVRPAALHHRADPPPAPPKFDFRPGIPDLTLFPRDAWIRSLRRAITRAPMAALDYPDPQGAMRARVALADYLNRSRATSAHESRIVFCTGNAQALRLMGQVLKDRGERRVAVEDPGHWEQCADLRASGMTTVPVPVDEGGIVVEQLRKADVGAVLLTPAHQYPTGAVLDPERRAELLRWAAARDAIIMEDDYDAEYRYDREPIGTMQGLAPERVVYMGTASKMLAPALRLAWMVLPSGLVKAVGQAKTGSDRGSPSLDQLTLAEFLERGELDRHLRRTRAIYRRRRDAMVASLDRHLPGLPIRGVAAGLHLLLDLPDGSDEAGIQDAARSRGIRVRGARQHYARSSSAKPGLLLGYGAIGEENIGPAVRLLASML
jgi:GntR family transcriptional regulator/MocR family aminotransferase